MNMLWGGMQLIGILYGAFNGRMQEITDAVLSASREAGDALRDDDGGFCFLAGTDGGLRRTRGSRMCFAERSGR